MECEWVSFADGGGVGEGGPRWVQRTSLPVVECRNACVHGRHDTGTASNWLSSQFGSRENKVIASNQANNSARAYGYAIFPSVGKGAAGVGGAYGKGEVFERGKPKGKLEIRGATGTVLDHLYFRDAEALRKKYLG